MVNIFGHAWAPSTGRSRLAPSSPSSRWRSFGAFGDLRMPRRHLAQEGLRALAGTGPANEVAPLVQGQVERRAGNPRVVRQCVGLRQLVAWASLPWVEVRQCKASAGPAGGRVWNPELKELGPLATWRDLGNDEMLDNPAGVLRTAASWGLRAPPAQRLRVRMPS